MHKNAKKVFVILIILLMCIGMLVGCGGTQEESTDSNGEGAKDKKLIGVLIGDFSDQFQSYLKEGMEDAAKELSNEIDVVFYDAKFDPNEQLKQAENLISQNVDAIVLVPTDAEACKPMALLTKEADIPLITCNSKLANQEEALSYVGSDSVESGEILMGAVAELLNGKGNIVVLHGMYGHEAEIKRQEGILNILKNYPDIKIVAEDTGNWYRDKAMDVMENWVQSGMKFDAVVAHNDEMAIGALLAIEDAGLTDEIIIGGIDATPEAIEFLKQGKLDVTVFQDAKGQGRKAMEVAAAAVKGEEVEKEYMIPYELVTPDKADEYLERYK